MCLYGFTFCTTTKINIEENLNKKQSKGLSVLTMRENCALAKNNQ
jgi:hypothetical protein